MQEESVKAANSKRYTLILPTPKHPVNTVIANRSTNYPAKSLTTQLALPSTSFNKSANAGNTSQRRLSQKEYEEKRSKNLCFYCDQKYVPGHKCSGQMFSLEVLGEEETHDSVEEIGEQVIEEVMEEPVICPHISLNALAGVNTFHTMRVKGHVGRQDIHILVDSGSTHNFVDVLCAKKLGCEIRSICPLQVEVPGGNQMLSSSTCRNFTWSLQGQIFKSDVMLLPLGGCDMVLGVQWLSTLGDIKWNFHTLRMEFTFQEFGETLLEQFQDVFAIPNTLPPHRSHDHKIILQEGAPPVNIDLTNTLLPKKMPLSSWLRNC
ncbi:reverse transcriptase [Tanacetum coccineum]